MTKDLNESAESCPVDHKTREAWLEKSRAAQTATRTAKSSSSTSTTKPVIQLYHAESGRIRTPEAFTLVNPTSSKQQRLGTDREVSSIPRALSSSLSSHSASSQAPRTAANNEQETGTSEDGRWIYPSEHQFFNALMRKKHPAQEQDMHSIVPIHNAVNERAWAEILRWEKGKGGDKCGGPKLESFSGLSHALTPRARWKTWMGYTAPFDRHDWVVDRCGTRVEYVIDFYEGKNEHKDGRPLNFFLDVRPKLNSFEGWKMRIEKALGLT